jgi:pyrroloquinoline quinone (PQQ) biosynthesis protein C
MSEINTDLSANLHIPSSEYDWKRSSPYPIEEFLEIVDRIVDNYFYAFRHPLGIRQISGELSRAELKFLACQEFHYYNGTTWWNALKIANARTIEEQRRLHVALLDELGTDLVDKNGLPAHRELFLQYCVGLGLCREEVLASPIVPGVIVAVTELMRIARERPHYEFLAASNMVVERMRPKHYHYLLETMDKHYSWIPKSARLFYEVHAHLDVAHESLGRSIVKSYMHEKSAQDAVMSSVIRSLALREAMYDSIHSAMSGRGLAFTVWPNFPREPGVLPQTDHAI